MFSILKSTILILQYIEALSGEHADKYYKAMDD